MAQAQKFPELRIEAPLMDQLRDIVRRREQVQGLLQNAEENKTTVKPAIYSKVNADYKSRIAAIAAEFAPVSERVQKALEEVQKRERDIRARLQEVNDDLEEQKFRCQIGEFSGAELGPMEREMTQVQADLNEQIEILEETYAECSRCLSEPAGISGSAPPTPGEPPAVAPAPSRPAPPSEAAASRRPTTPPPAPGTRKPSSKATARATQERLQAQTTHALRLPANDDEQDLFPLLADKVSIGRSPKSDIVIKVAGVSRTHAHIIRTQEGSFTIIDTSGGGGIRVNGKPTKKATLAIGDVIGIANLEIEVVPP